MSLGTSLLYRLMDHAPEQLQEDVQSPADYSTLQQEICNHIEQILNTRINFFNLSERYSAVKTSILNYGMPDFARRYYSVKQKQTELCQNIATIIEIYEPRLQQVQVQAIETPIKKERTLVIRIEGMIAIQTVSKPAVFESTLDILSYQFNVNKRSS